jgi:hypothetical protein
MRITLAFADADDFDILVINPPAIPHLLRDKDHPSFIQLPIAQTWWSERGGIRMVWLEVIKLLRIRELDNRPSEPAKSLSQVFSKAQGTAIGEPSRYPCWPVEEILYNYGYHRRQERKR